MRPSGLPIANKVPLPALHAVQSAFQHQCHQGVLDPMPVEPMAWSLLHSPTWLACTNQAVIAQHAPSAEAEKQLAQMICCYKRLQQKRGQHL